MKEKLFNAFTQMNDNEIISVWNEYCYETSRYDDEILDAERLEEWIKSGYDVMAILNRFYFGSDEEREGTSANPNRNYFTFNGYGNIISFDYIYNSFSNEFYYIDIDDLIEYIIENNDALYNDEIQEILDAAEEGEEE